MRTVELVTFLDFQRQLDRAASRADLDDVLRDLKREHDREDPDVSAIGEMIAMLRPLLPHIAPPARPGA